MLSKKARRALKKLTDAAKGSGHLLRVDGGGDYYLANGKRFVGAGIEELIDAKVLKPSYDALLPGMTQTYQFNPAANL